MTDELIRLDTTMTDEEAKKLLFTMKDVIYFQPVKHGEWKINSDGYYPYCSVCGTAADQLTKHLTKYCPECGARMAGDKVLELKPCFCCKCKPAVIRLRKKCYMVSCKNPMCFSVEAVCADTEEKAIIAWNRRAENGI